MADDNTTITANQAYNQSGSNLSFADWLAQQKAQGTIVEGVQLLAKDFGIGSSAPKSVPANTVTTGNTIFGIDQTKFIIGALVIIGVTTGAIIAYRHYKKIKG